MLHVVRGKFVDDIIWHAEWSHFQGLYIFSQLAPPLQSVLIRKREVEKTKFQFTSRERILPFQKAEVWSELVTFRIISALAQEGSITLTFR